MSDVQARLRRRWLYLPFAIAAVIVLGYYLLWRTGAAEMEKAVAAWAEDQRAAGMTVEYSALIRDGFPFFLRVHVEDPFIETPEGLRWRGERLSMDALPYELNKVIFSPMGAQFVSTPDTGDWRITADDLRASIATDDARGWVLSANAGGVQARREEDGAETTLASLVFDLSPSADDPSTLVLSLAGAGAAFSTMDNGSDNADGSAITVDRLQTVAFLTQSHLLQGDMAASQWRDGGGALVINGLIAEIDEAALTVSGEIRLDRDDYLTGALRTELSNPAGLAGFLRQTGALSPQEADAAIAGLSLMALAGGGKIAAPIELKDGQARISGIKVADLPKVQ